MKKILIFGGTFNPVHNGHIYMCRTLSDYIDADEVYIIPTFTPVHKEVDKSLVSSEHRLNMCNLAFDRKNEFVSDLEVKQGRPCYSYETLTWFSESCPDAQLYLACGSDMFLSLHTWRNPQILFEKAIVCAVSRQEDYGALKHYAEKHSRDGLRSIIVDAEPMIISSTQIRDNIKFKDDFSGMPEQVADYIKRNNLYL